MASGSVDVVARLDIVTVPEVEVTPILVVVVPAEVLVVVVPLPEPVVVVVVPAVVVVVVAEPAVVVVVVPEPAVVVVVPVEPVDVVVVVVEPTTVHVSPFGSLLEVAKIICAFQNWSRAPRLVAHAMPTLYVVPGVNTKSPFVALATVGEAKKEKLNSGGAWMFPLRIAVDSCWNGVPVVSYKENPELGPFELKVSVVGSAEVI